MADLLQSGQDWLASQLKTHASRDVVYQRGASQVIVSATIGRTLLKLDDYDGIRMEWTDRDFLIQAADLVLGAEMLTPERGDLVKETVGTLMTTYEVAAYPQTSPDNGANPREVCELGTGPICVGRCNADATSAPSCLVISCGATRFAIVG